MLLIPILNGDVNPVLSTRMSNSRVSLPMTPRKILLDLIRWGSFMHPIPTPSLMVMIPSPHNSMKIGTSSTPPTAVRIQPPPSYLQAPRAKTMMTQMYRRQVLVDLQLCTATALPFALPPQGNVLFIQTKWITNRYKLMRANERIVLPQCAGKIMKTQRPTHELSLQAQTENC